MIVSAFDITGAFVLDYESIEDDRGIYMRGWRRDACREHGMATEFEQTNISVSHRRGTLRGLHWQLPPGEEAKLVQCTQGAIFDVIVDMRPDSPTFRRWAGAELNASHPQMLYIPPTCAHGFLTLEDHAQILYASTGTHEPSLERGLRFDDPAIDIRWPIDIQIISEKDKHWPLLDR